MRLESQRPIAGATLLVAFIVAALVAGCVSVHVVPTALPLPESPELRFTVCQPGRVCLDERDGNALRRYLDSMAAFRAAWERLRAP